MEKAAFALPDLEATAAFGAKLATLLQAGDVLLLRGDLGSGKTALARALIQALAGEEIVVNSPTFTLMQPYDVTLKDSRLTCWHIDLYRIEDPNEVEELGLMELQPEALLLIEWPERLGGTVFRDAILCHLDVAPEGGGRMVTLSFAGRSALRHSQVLHVLS